MRRGAQCGVDTDESGTRTVDEVPPTKADVAQFDTEPAEVSWSGLFTDSVEQTTQQSDNTRPYYNYTNR